MTELPVVFDQDGLLPVVIQDDESNAVLMLAFMNREALERTRISGRVHFWSRSRQKLWMKGETSGHEQLVRSVHVNCYENSLLIRVEQIGACCHTGHPTCYFRELTDVGDLVETEVRIFDPEDVYGVGDGTDLTLWLGAYQWLADNDLIDVSGTSRLLRTADVSDLASRVADELREVSGVLSGEHRHATLEVDLLLEGSQSLYWMVLSALRAGITSSSIQAAILRELTPPIPTAADSLPAHLGILADRWANTAEETIQELLGESVSALAAAAGLGEVTVAAMIASDMAELRTRPYLVSYFSLR